MMHDHGLTGVSYPCYQDLEILANTPGIPIEWIYAACAVPSFRRGYVRYHIGLPSLVEQGLKNAASVVKGDGMKLLKAVVPGYSGAIPLWSQLELQTDGRSDGEIAQELGVDRLKVRRWRTNIVFDPITGGRLIGNRGRQIKSPL